MSLKITGASRRRFIGGAVAATAAFAAMPLTKLLAGTAAPTVGAAGAVTLDCFDAQKKALGTCSQPRLSMTDAQWHTKLSPIAFDVTRHGGTERAYTGPGWDNHANGLYRCICCDTALFDSATKFDSGTGWPSFYQPISKRNVAETKDSSLFMDRIAVSCPRCDAHLGHVFDDGPRPTGLRYCMNAVAMRFVAAA